MEKVSTFFKSSITRVMLVLAAVLCSLSASAAADWGAIELGKDYVIPMFNSAKGTFTAPQSGTVIATSVSGPYDIEVFTDADQTQPVDVEVLGAYQYPYEKHFEVESGKTYYVFTGMVWDNITVKFDMAGSGNNPLEIVDLYPAEGGVYDLASDGFADLQFTFNQSVKCDQGYFIMYYDPNVPDNQPEQAHWIAKNYPNGVVLVNGTLLAVKDVQANIIALMKQRGFKNTKIRVVLNNLTSSTGESLANGKFMDANQKCPYFEFKVGDIPMVLSSVTYPDQFLSYWLPGSEEAKFEATFSGNLGTTYGTKLKVCYGNPEVDNGYYEGEVPMTIEGNKISADLGGVLRTPATMLPVTQGSYGEVTLQLVSVCDEAGGSAIGNVSGSIGKFAWTIPYKVIDRATVAYEFTPGTGASIAGKDEIELWINSLNTIAFTGFKFENTNSNVTESTVVVPVENAQFEKGDSDDEGVYIIPVPAESKAAKGVTVTLDGLTSKDGYNHEGEVKAVYGKMAITSADPANGTTMEKLLAGTILTVETTSSAAYPEMVMVYEIEDLNPEDPEEAIIKSMSYMTRNDDGSYSSEIFGNYTMYTGHQYKVTFTAWANPEEEHYGETLGSDYIVWNGGTAPYTFSGKAFFEGIDPEEGTVLTPNDRVFTVKFSKVVCIGEGDAVINAGMGATEAFESVEAIDRDTRFVDMVYAKEWKLTVPESFMAQLNGQLIFSFRCVDEDDLLVKGNFGKEANSRFMFTYECANRFEDIDVAYTDGKLVASHPSGLMPSWTVPTANAYVMKKAGGEVVANVADLHCPIDDMDWNESADYTNTEVHLILNKDLEENQAYVLYIPANYFNVGTEFNQKNSAEKYFEFATEGQGGDDPVDLNITVNPIEGEVTSLSEIHIWFNDYDEVGLGSGKANLEIFTFDGGTTNVNLPDAEYGDDWDVLNEVVQELDNSYVADGRYIISFPKGYFLLGANGEESPAFSVGYTIGSLYSGVGTITVTMGDKVKVYDLNGVLRMDGDNDQLNNLPAGIYIVNGKKQVVK